MARSVSSRRSRQANATANTENASFTNELPRVDNAIATAALGNDITPAQNQEGGSGFLSSEIAPESNGGEGGGPKGLLELVSGLGDSGLVQKLADSGILETANTAFGAARDAITEMIAQNPEVLNRAGDFGMLGDDVLGVQNHLDVLQGELNGLVENMEAGVELNDAGIGAEAIGAENEADAEQDALATAENQANAAELQPELAPEGVKGEALAAQKGEGEEEATGEENGAEAEMGLTAGAGVAAADPGATGGDGGGGEGAPGGEGNAAGMGAMAGMGAAAAAGGAAGGAAAGGGAAAAGGGAATGGGAGGRAAAGAVKGTRDVAAPRSAGARKGAPAKPGGGGLPSLPRTSTARAPGGGGGGGSVNAPAAAVAVNTNGGSKEGAEEEGGEQSFETTANFDYDLPGELQNLTPPSATQDSLDLSTTPSNVGEGMTPQESSYQGPTGAMAGVNAAANGSLTETGMNAASAAAGAAVSAAAGTVAGRASAAGGGAQVTPTVEGRNAAVNTEMTATAAPDVGTLEFAEGGQAAGGGESAQAPANAAGEVSLGDPTAPEMNYAGGSGDRLPSVTGAELPDFASQAAATAASAVQNSAAQLDPVGPAAAAQIAAGITPKQAEGNAAVTTEISAYEGQVPGFESNKASTISEAAAGSAEAAATQAANAAAAAAEKAAKSGEFSASPVPAELENAQSTIADVVAKTSANAAAATAGQPMVELPGAAVAGMEQAASDMDGFTNDFVGPDLAADFGAIDLPDPGLDVQAFETLVDPAGFEFDESKLPTASSGGGAGAGMHPEVEAEVMARIEPEVAKQQEAVRQGVVTDGSEGLEGLREAAEGTYEEGASFCDNAVAEWEAIDIESEIASHDAAAKAAGDTAMADNQNHVAEMSTQFNEAQNTFDSDCVAGTDGFATEIDAATTGHESNVGNAGDAYDAAITNADTALRTGHDNALGQYQGATEGAIQGAQNSFTAEQQAAATALDGHQNQISTEMGELQNQANQVGNDATAQFESQFQAEQQRAEGERDRLLADAESQVGSLESEGNAEVQAELNAGQQEASATIDTAVSKANQDVSTANQEASQKMADAEKEPSLIDRIVGWLQKQISAALDWIKSKFDEVKNAINSALESAKNAALGILEAAKSAALGVLDRVRNAIQAAISIVADAINAVIEVVSTALQAAVQAVTTFVNSAIQSITDAITGALEAFQGVVNAVIDGFVNVVSLIDEDLGMKLDEATQGFQDTFNSVVDTAQAGVEAASQTMQSAVDAAGDELQSSIEAAENGLQDKVTAAEEGLNSAVDAAYDTAAAAVEATFDTLESAVEATFDAAQAAVTLMIDTAYGAIEAGVRAMEEVVVSGLQKLDQAVQWVNENIVGPFTEFLASAWEGLQRFWVSFWNSAFRDILLGIALTALAVAITVATGGAGAPLALVILASAMGTGATAAVVYGAGELAAREANQSLTTGMQVDMSAEDIRRMTPEEVQAIADEQDVTWDGATYIDPATGQLLPDFTDPKNSWYADTMGDITSDQDGGVSYRNDAGELIKLTPEEMATMDPAAREALAQQIYDRDEDGNFTGESFGDSLRGSAALAAEKGIEHAISGAVTAATMGTGAGAGLGVQGLQSTGRVGLMQMARAQATSSAINATAGVATHAAAGTVGEMIEDDRDDWGEAYDEGTKYDSLGDVAVDWGAQFGADFTTSMISAGVNNRTNGTYHGGQSSLNGVQQFGLDTGVDVVNNSIKAGFSTAGDNLIDNDKSWNDGLGDAMFTTDHLTSAVGNQVGNQVTNTVGGRRDNGDVAPRRATEVIRNSATGTLGNVAGNVVTTTANTAIDGNLSELDRALFDQTYYEEHPELRRRGQNAPLSGQSIATSVAGATTNAITDDLKENGIWAGTADTGDAGVDSLGHVPYNIRGMSEAEIVARNSGNYDAVRNTVVGGPPDPDNPPAGYHYRRNSDGEIIAVVRSRADDAKHAPLTIDDNGNVAFGTSRNNSGDNPGTTPREALLAQRAAEQEAEEEVAVATPTPAAVETVAPVEVTPEEEAPSLKPVHEEEAAVESVEALEAETTVGNENYIPEDWMNQEEDDSLALANAFAGVDAGVGQVNEVEADFWEGEEQAGLTPQIQAALHGMEQRDAGVVEPKVENDAHTLRPEALPEELLASARARAERHIASSDNEAYIASLNHYMDDAAALNELVNSHSHLSDSGQETLDRVRSEYQLPGIQFDRLDSGHMETVELMDQAAQSGNWGAFYDHQNRLNASGHDSDIIGAAMVARHGTEEMANEGWVQAGLAVANVQRENYIADPETLEGSMEALGTNVGAGAQLQKYLGQPPADLTPTERSAHWAGQMRERLPEDHPAHDLHDAELLSTLLYTSSYYDQMNGALRTRDPEQVEAMMPFIQGATSAINSLPRAGANTRRRTTSNSQALDEQWHAGGFSSDNAFSSTSQNPNLTNFGTQYMFDQENSYGADVNALSAYGPIFGDAKHTESEILLPPGARTEITGEVQDGNSRWLQVRELRDVY